MLTVLRKTPTTSDMRDRKMSNTQEPASIVKQEILQELREATEKQVALLTKVNELQDRIELLARATECEHEWEDGGSSLHVVDYCPKCKYSRYV